ncbi:MAG: helix-turn-helix transcriptional regulator [Thermodesulfobacteriota bacterium]|nr:helix-turn-helix transcriptional regulator [Thermodesulfobacteriota bacterium]
MGTITMRTNAWEKVNHTKTTLFEIKGNIPPGIMEYLHREFGQNVEIVDENEELVNIFDTHWYKDIKKTISPGDTLRIYRQNLGLTQTELGQKLGKFTRQKISDMENNKRSISKAVANKLSKIFDVPIERFL